MLKCRDVLALGSVYVDGAQTARARLALRAHLLICGHCRQYIRSLRLTVASVQSLRLPVSEAEVARILAQLPRPE
ncbi:MAG: anti-sigma factor family protein [Moraxellaceae bacterium]